MLVAFSFRAKPGNEKDLERLLNNPEAARIVAQGLGATRNVLFFRDGRMIRIMEFPETGPRGTLVGLARENPNIAAFLRTLGPLVQDGFDYDRPETLEAFNQRIFHPIVYDVGVSGPSTTKPRSDAAESAPPTARVG